MHAKRVVQTVCGARKVRKRGMLETLFLIHRAKLLLPISPHPMDQQGSPCCLHFLAVTSSYHNKVYFVDALDADKLPAAV